MPANDSRGVRRPLATATAFVRNADVPAQPVRALEGVAGGGGLDVKPLLVGDEMLLMEVHRPKGRIDPEHTHPDHESMCYLVSGRMRVVIGTDEFIAEAGDCWVHKPGVPHWHETLEQAVQIEIKAPPRKTWT